MQTEKSKILTFSGLLQVILPIVLAAAVGVAVYAYVNSQNARKIAHLEQNLIDIRSTIHVDSIRQFNLQKVISIIDDYNSDMPQHQKYEIAEEIFSMTQKYPNLDIDLLCATITHESAGTWDPQVVSPAGALGLMQVMPATGMFIAMQEGISWTSAEDILFDPIHNIRIGSRYLSTLIENYDVDGGLAAYNGGERRAANWINQGKPNGILAKETQHYVPAIQKLYQHYKTMTL